MLSFPRLFRLLSAMESNSLPRSTADLAFVPEPIRIASNSASLNEDVPLWYNFSLGRSSTAQSVIFIDIQRDIKVTPKIRKKIKKAVRILTALVGLYKVYDRLLTCFATDDLRFEAFFE
jgi:hypothetical protein